MNYTQALDDYFLRNPDLLEHTPELTYYLKIEAARAELRQWTEDETIKPT